MVAKLIGKLDSPLVFNNAAFDTLIVPPTTLVALLQVNVPISKIPEVTRMLPLVALLPYNNGRLAAKDLVPLPLIFNVEYEYAELIV